MKKNTIQGWFDGVCEPTNPGGHGAYGAVIKNGNEVLLQESGYVGHGELISNNVAEYSGFIRILEYLLEKGLEKERVEIRGDSNLVIQQVNGLWKIRGGIYVPFAIKAQKLFVRFSNINLEWIPREQNSIVDVLSKKILLDMGIKFKIQPNKP